MSELQVNSISPSTAGATTITIDAQVIGQPATEPYHFVTYGQLGINFNAPATGIPQTYVDSQDQLVLTASKEYASLADSAALQLANAYCDIQNNIQTINFNDSISFTNSTILQLNQKVNSSLKTWTEMNVYDSSDPTVLVEENIRLLTQKEQIIVVDTDGNTKSLNELNALGIYQNDTDQEINLSIILSTGGDGTDPSDGSLPAASVLLVGNDLTTIAADFDVSTSTPSTSSPPTIGYINSYSKQTSASTITLFTVVSPKDYYRVVVTDHITNKEQVLVSWQEYKVVRE